MAHVSVWIERLQDQLSTTMGRKLNFGAHKFKTANILILLAGILFAWIEIVSPEMGEDNADEQIFIIFNYYVILTTMYVIFSIGP